MHRKKQIIMYLYLAFLSVGVILVFIALNEYKKTKELLLEGTVVDAVVIDLIKVDTGDGVGYKPVFKYKDLSGTTKTFTRKSYSSPPDYKIGEKAKLIYNPRNESEIKIMSYWGLYGITIILLAIASPLLIIGGGYFLYMRNN